MTFYTDEAHDATKDEPRTHCTCRHNTADPERGCECGWAEACEAERDLRA